MPTPVLLRDQHGNLSTKMYDLADLKAFRDGGCALSEMPPDEGIDRSTCYLLDVVVG